MSSTASPVPADRSYADLDQFNLAVTLLIPIGGMMSLIIVVHIFLLRMHTAFRDSVNSKDTKTSSLPSQKELHSQNPLVLAEMFIANNPPTTFPPDSSGNLNLVGTGRYPRPLGNDKLSINTQTNEFTISFRVGVNAATFTHACSYDLTIVSMSNPCVVVAMGFARFPFPEHRLPGWHKGSVAFHTNLRKFVDRGGHVGNPFPLLPSDDYCIPKNQQHSYTITFNPGFSEVYITQGSGQFKYTRVLAHPNELKLNEFPYFPMIGANGPCVVRVRPFIPSEKQLVQVRADAWNAERNFYSSSSPTKQASPAPRVQSPALRSPPRTMSPALRNQSPAFRTRSPALS